MISATLMHNGTEYAESCVLDSNGILRSAAMPGCEIPVAKFLAK